MTSMPAPLKSRTLRVATERPLALAMAAMADVSTALGHFFNARQQFCQVDGSDVERGGVVRIQPQQDGLPGQRTHSLKQGK